MTESVNRRVRISTFAVWSVASGIYMLVYFDTRGLPTGRFVLGIFVVSMVALLAEALLVRVLTGVHPHPMSRSRWLRDYAIIGGSGSAILIGALDIIGLGQGRSLAVMALVVMTGIINSWLIGYAIDEMVSYRRSAAKARDESLPRLRMIRSMNEHLSAADEAADNRERDVIRSAIQRPLHKLRQRAVRAGDDEAAASIEAFISDVLRPLSHHMHPITPKLGLVKALDTAGYRVVAPPVVIELDAAGELLDDDVRIETYRWIAESLRVTDGNIQVNLSLGERALCVELIGSHGQSLDPLQLTAGLTVHQTPEPTPDSPSRLMAPLRGQLSQHFLADFDTRAHRPTRREFLRSEWQWRGDTAGPPIPLVAAIAVTALPALTFIANPSIDRSAALATGLTWVVVPVTLAWVLSRVRARGNGLRQFLWFLFTWIGLGVVTGLISAFAVLFFDPTAGTVVIAQEIARASMRLTVLGGLVAFTAELAHNAERTLEAIEEQHRAAGEQRRFILERAQDRSRLIAEVLHRRVQGRMAAIALLFRMHHRDRAIRELDYIDAQVLPDLMSSLGGDPHPTLRTLEYPAGIDVRIERDDSAQGLPEATESLIGLLIEEAAANAIRHGQATTLTASIRTNPTHVLLTCSDNGLGCAADPTAGLGSRLFDEAVGDNGLWRLSSAPGAGARVDFAISIGQSVDHDPLRAGHATLAVVDS